MENTFRARWLRLTAIATCLLGTCLGLQPGLDGDLPVCVIELGFVKLLHWPTTWAVGEEPGLAAWSGQIVVTSLLWGAGAGWVLARLTPFLRLSLALAVFNFLSCAAFFELSERSFFGLLDAPVFETLPEPLLQAIAWMTFYLPQVLLMLPLGGQFLLILFEWETEYQSPLQPLFGDGLHWPFFSHVAANSLVWGLLVATAIRLIIRRRSALCSPDHRPLRGAVLA